MIIFLEKPQGGLWNQMQGDLRIYENKHWRCYMRPHCKAHPNYLVGTLVISHLQYRQLSFIFLIFILKQNPEVMTVMEDPRLLGGD